ncbi:MAG: OmpH family outer membrane protein [Chlamydiota bacterium]
MMFHKFIIATLATFGLSAGAFAAESTANIGVVDFAKCVTESKPGKQEQDSFEMLKNQMSGALQETEKQLNDISTKLNDPEYLDGLSPEAEEELKVKFRNISEEMNRYQNQYYQILNQANMRIIHSLGAMINTAAEKVAKEKKLYVVMNKEACFFFADKLDVTNSVIAEMDKAYEAEAKKAPTNNENAA